MQVELLTKGGYYGTGTCVGKVFYATRVQQGYLIPIDQLIAAGFDSDGSIIRDMYFLPHEVRVIDG